MLNLFTSRIYENDRDISVCDEDEQNVEVADYVEEVFEEVLSCVQL